jgi:hypothetical protein
LKAYNIHRNGFWGVCLMLRIVLAATTALAGIVGTTAPLCAAPVKGLRTVALSGQSVPGTTGDVSYDGFEPPVLNLVGETAFIASLTGANVTSASDLGIWSEGSGSLDLVALKGSQAPGAPSGVSFSDFQFHVLSAAGELSFRAQLIGPGVNTTNDRGGWSGDSTGLMLLAREGDPAAGLPGNVQYNLVFAPALNNAGQTAFFASLTGAVTTSNDSGIWSDRSGSLVLVVREGDQAPDTPSGVNFSFLGGAPLNAAGQTAFRAFVVGNGVDPTNDEGIWSEGSGSLRLVARGGNHAPGTSLGVNFSEFESPAINAAGHTAFLASLAGSGVDTVNDEGIWSEGSGSLTLIARGGEQAPGLVAGVNFFNFTQEVQLNDAGQTSFFASLIGSGVSPGNNQSIWSEGSGTLALVARTGDQAPGVPADVMFVNLLSNPPTLNAAGQTAFLASVGGSGIDGSNNEGLWATDRQGALQLIVRDGDQIEVAPSDFRTIQFLGFTANSGNGDGRPSGFNDRGQITFVAYFTDGSSGVFVSNLVAVPEPAALIAGIIGFAGLQCCRSGRAVDKQRLTADSATTFDTNTPLVGRRRAHRTRRPGQ